MRAPVSFITTPIFYANAKPHIGHAYTLCIADAWARFAEIRGHPSLQAFPHLGTPLFPTADTPLRTRLSTGVDEYGTKIAQTAANLGVAPQHLCDQTSSHFKQLCNILNVQPHAFIRTTDNVHHQTVKAMWKRLESRDFLYWSTFSGWYSATDEAFYSQWEVDNSGIGEKSAMVSKISGSRVEWIDEKTCRFRLNQFKPQLHTWLDSGVLPSGSQEHQRLLAETHKILELLEDPSLSRPSTRVPWGIPVPGHPDQTIYVWFDALMSYITASGSPLNLLSNNPNEVIWPPSVQFVGKDILRFHAILWPALLLAADLPLPEQIIPHAHILVDGIKMSKSVGNVLSPFDLVDHFSAGLAQSPAQHEDDFLHPVAQDCLRYCLVRSVCLNEDTTFAPQLAEKTLNTELVNWLGNLLSRATSTTLNPDQTVNSLNVHEVQEMLSRTSEDADLFESLVNLPTEFDHLWWNSLQPNRSVDLLMEVIRKTNAFFTRHEPWNPTPNCLPPRSVVDISLESLRLAGGLLQPVVPHLSHRLLQRLGSTPGDSSVASRCLGTRSLPLIPRISCPSFDNKN